MRRGKLAARCWGSLENTYHTALVINIGVSTMMKKLFNRNIGWGDLRCVMVLSRFRSQSRVLLKSVARHRSALQQ